MGYKKSVLDDISDALAPQVRKLKDISQELVGTKTKIIRIKQTEMSMMGDITYEYQSAVVNNVIIRYPFSSIELYASKDEGELNNTALDLFDLLPISMTIPFDAYLEIEAVLSGQTSSPVELDENDIIVDVLYDNNDNPIPIKMKVSRIYGGFFGRNQTNRKYDLNLVRGDMEDDIQNIIDVYISGEASKI